MVQYYNTGDKDSTNLIAYASDPFHVRYAVHRYAKWNS